jgi:Sigma-70, region 4
VSLAAVRLPADPSLSGREGAGRGPSLGSPGPHNLAADGYRRQGRLQRKLALLRPVTERLADPTAKVDLRDALVRLMLQLPPKQRAVLVLRYWEQLSEAETAAVLDSKAVNEAYATVRWTMYVDPRSYLPVRIIGSTQTYGGTAGNQISPMVTNVQWLPPIPSNTALALVTIPPGFHLFKGLPGNQ